MEKEDQENHVVRIPFSFTTLPLDGPLSGTYDMNGARQSVGYAAVGYYVKIVGVTIDGKETKLQRLFKYFPRAGRAAALNKCLESGPWTGPCKAAEETLLMNGVHLHTGARLSATVITVRWHSLAAFCYDRH